MIYRILKSPHGYEDPLNYILCMYADLTLKTGSLLGTAPSPLGRGFFPTIEEARAAIPGAAKQLDIPPVYQFLEAWEMEEPVE